MSIAENADTKEILGKILDNEKLKNCFECGICTASCSMVGLLDNEYNPRILLEKIVLNPVEVLDSEKPWLCAWCYRCYKRCPQALKLPEIFLLMRTASLKQGRTKPLDDALQKIVESIPLPTVATLLCFHPERAGLDKEQITEKIQKIRGDCSKPKKKKKAQNSSKAKVGVIGSGPAGLTVASELSRKGVSVTIFESLSGLGGMLRKCIPEHRLPAEVLNREIQCITDAGVDVRTGVTLGRDLGFEDLWKEGYQAVFIGTGAHKSQELRIEGRQLKGVVNALDFLWNVRSGKNLDVGKNVVVVGGGNVAVDAANTALKMGAKSVAILYRRSREEMPANPWEVKEAENEGVKIEFLVVPSKILGETTVAAVECVRTQLGEPDESGRRKATPIQGSELKRETDMVILAIGETPDLSFLPKEIETNEEGTVSVNPVTLETSMKGVFAGGDVARGPASVIEAICDGKKAAQSIENYLKSLVG